MKIISGGQVGVDIAALRAAKAVGFETGGWMPNGFKTRVGNKPEYAELYGMKDTASFQYPVRTELNVAESDGTLRIARNWNSAGELCTLRNIHKHNKPHLDIDYNIIEDSYATIHFAGEWIFDNGIQVLNVAGNADKDMEDPVCDFLTRLWFSFDFQARVVR